MGKKLLLIGGGGHCRSVLDTARSAGIYDEFGIIDFADSACPGVPVIGRDEDIPQLVREGWTDGIITVGSVGVNAGSSHSTVSRVATLPSKTIESGLIV